MYDDYSVYTSFSGALEADAEAAKQNIFQKILEWFKKQIDKFTSLFHKEENPEKKSIWSKIVAGLKGWMKKVKNAKSTEEAGEYKDRAYEDLQALTKEAEKIDNKKAKVDKKKAPLDKKSEDLAAQKAENDAKQRALWEEVGAGATGEGDVDEDEEDDDIDAAIEAAVKIEKLASNDELKTAIENMASNIDMNCTTAEEALQYKENIENEIDKYNRDIKTLRFAAESARDYGNDTDRVNTIVAPAVESLRNSFAQIGLVTEAPSGIDEFACESMNYFLKTARKMINAKCDSFEEAAEQEVVANESFLATLTI